MAGMNPVTRILTFLIFGGFVAFGGVYELLIGLVLLLGLYAQNQFGYMPLCVKMLGRMRWFFLSILVLYLWFTPGANSTTSAFTLIPSYEGLRQGMLRVFSLVLIVMAVNYFIAPISRDKMVSAILWLFKPLCWIGINTQRLAVRVALTLSLVSKAQQLLTDSGATPVKDTGQPSAAMTMRARCSRIGDVAAQLFNKVVSEAVNTECQAIHINAAKPPSALQWALPGVTAVVFWGLPILLSQNL